VTGLDPVRRVDKPWGYEIHYALTDRYCGKILFVRAGEELSLQYHEVKDETLYLQAGRAEIVVGENVDALEVLPAEPGDAYRVRPGTIHRLRALEDSTFLEVSTPELDDVVRLEDRYGRAGLRPSEVTKPTV
jgi:mannose-6-phosphate isomerase-like protein (cupin superfamily)